MVDIKEDNFYYNHVDLNSVNKIKIEYTRSYSDYFRSFLFSLLLIILSGLFILFVLNYYGII